MFRHPLTISNLFGLLDPLPRHSQGCVAVEALGGPKVEFKFGRGDAETAAACPAIGRLPDANLGAQHLRDVFHRMGFSDQEIVALSGAHTLGRCHEVRSGFDGPWSFNPLKFDNTYFRHLLFQEWIPRKWDGPLQYEDARTGELMMLPTDLALVQDPKFKPHVVAYAKDQSLFFKDFAAAMAKLLSLGGPPSVQPGASSSSPASSSTSKTEQAEKKFLELAMHGSLQKAQEILAETPGMNTAALEKPSGRSALHKAAFWGHDKMLAWLCSKVRGLTGLRSRLGCSDTQCLTASISAESFEISKLFATLNPAPIPRRAGTKCP